MILYIALIFGNRAHVVGLLTHPAMQQFGA